MPSEIVVVNCPPGEYTLIGENVSGVSLKVRDVFSGNIKLLDTKVAFRIAISATEPDIQTQNYWSCTENTFVHASIDNNVYVMPEGNSTTINLEVFRTTSPEP